MPEPLSATPNQNRALSTVEPCSVTDFEVLAREVSLVASRLRRVATDLQTPAGLPVGGKLVMDVLARYGAKTVPQIAYIRSTSRQNIQVLVNRLEKKKQVSFLPNPSHKRSPFVQLTPEGEAALEEMRRKETGFEESLVSRLSKADVQCATELLEQVRTILATRPPVPESLHAPDPAQPRRSTPPEVVDGRRANAINSLDSISSGTEEPATHTELPVTLL